MYATTGYYNLMTHWLKPRNVPLKRFLDLHELSGVNEEQLKRMANEAEDIGPLYGVSYTLYYNLEAGQAFCLCEAPSKEAVLELHHELGTQPRSIIEVKEAA